MPLAAALASPQSATSNLNIASVKIQYVRFIPPLGVHHGFVFNLALAHRSRHRLGGIRHQKIGAAVKGFKDGIKDGQSEEQVENTAAGSSKKTIDVEAREKV